MDSTTTEIEQTTSSAFPKPVLSQYWLSEERSYYRSKLFNTKIGINPLIACASPIFATAGFLTEYARSHPADKVILFNNLQHEIKAFEMNAKIQHYHSETILAARYIICAFLDEVFSNAYDTTSQNTLSKDFQEFSLLTLFHHEKNGGERFFIILEKLSQDPEYHIDLLEFIYLCLNMGFQGKYKFEQDGKEILAHITDRLFEGIRNTRGDLKKELHIAPIEKTPPPVIRLHIPVWLIVSFTVALLLTIYCSFSYMLGNNTQTLYQEIEHIVLN